MISLALAKSLSTDLTAVKEARGNAKKELAKEWHTPAHKLFLALVGNNKRQWFTTMKMVDEAEPCGADLPLNEILEAAEIRAATPQVTAGRIQAKLQQGWPRNVIAAIIDKKLDAGITVAAIKKAQGVVKEFQPALCADWCKMSDKKRSKILQEREFYSTPKMDGLRCVIKVHTRDRGVYSRTLKPLFNMDHFVDALEAAIPFPCHVDGEAYAADGTWNSSMTGTKKKGADIEMMFFPFDLVLRTEVDSKRYEMPAHERWALMEKHIPYDDKMFVEVCRTRVTTISEVMEEHAAEVRNGWEGTVLHDANAPYANGRSQAWVKCKEWLSDEFTCVGFFPGTGKHTGRLGGIRVRAEYDGREIDCEVGTGFTDKERQEIWDNQEDYLGLPAEVKFFEVTEDDSLRFPSFLRWRLDKV